MAKAGSARVGVLFDLDGTLVDSNYFHVVAWWRAFADSGIELPMAAIHRHIGMGSGRLIKELLGKPDDRVKEAHGQRFASLRDQVVALPGAAALLSEVSRRGALVVLATSAREEDLDALLRPLGAARSVLDLVISAKDVDQTKPDPQVFQLALERAGLEPSRAVAVGDTVWDVEAARKTGLRCVCVTCGGIGRQELEAAGAAAIYEDPQDLLANLDTSPLGTLLSAAAA
jgi:HAD superfamily hydrolase (TIGR01509 family)